MVKRTKAYVDTSALIAFASPIHRPHANPTGSRHQTQFATRSLAFTPTLTSSCHQTQFAKAPPSPSPLHIGILIPPSQTDQPLILQLPRLLHDALLRLFDLA